MLKLVELPPKKHKLIIGISLKKENDKKGAQLISSKSEEASGCVNAAILHWENVDKGDIVGNEGYKRAIEILGVDMLNSARKDVAIPVSAGKRDLLEWYLSPECGRLEALKDNPKLTKIYKDIAQKEDLKIREYLLKFLY